MTAEEAVQRMKGKFPFPFSPTHPTDAHVSIAEVVQRHLPPGSKVLDFGAGPADKTAVLAELGYKCATYDDLNDPWHREPANREKILNFAKSYGIQYAVANGDGKIPFDDESFDMVMSHDVIEHLHDSPRDLFNALLEKVRPEGFLFITVPNAANIRKRIAVLRGKTNHPPYSNYYWWPGPWRGHVREYVRDDLASMADYLGCDVVELTAHHHMLHRVPKPVLPVYKAVTSVFRDWRDTWVLVARKRKGWKPRYTLPDDELRKMLPSYRSYAYD